MQVKIAIHDEYAEYRDNIFTLEEINFNEYNITEEVWRVVRSLEESMPQDINELFSKIKVEYKYLLSLLNMGVISVNEFIHRSNDPTTLRHYKIINNYYEAVKYSLKHSPYLRIGNNEILINWFFGITLNHDIDVMITDSYVIHNLARLLSYLRVRGLTIDQQRRVITSFVSLYEAVEPAYRKELLIQYIQWLNGIDDYGKLLVMSIRGDSMSDDIMTEAGFYRNSLEYISVFPEYYKYLMGRNKINNIKGLGINFDKHVNVVFSPQIPIIPSDNDIITKTGCLIRDGRVAFARFYLNILKGECFYQGRNTSYIGSISSVAYEEITEETPIIIYGDLEQRSHYTIDDIIMSMGYRDDSSIPELVMMKNNGMRADLSLKDYNSLLNIVATIANSIDVEGELFDKTLDVINKLKEIIGFIENAGTALYPLIRANREAAKELYTDIVTMGLYFRRWKGPGSAFPYATMETNNLGVNPEVLAAPLIHKYRSIVQNHGIVMEMLAKTPCWNNNKTPVSDAFMQLFINTVRGHNCIRVSSTFFIFTGTKCLSLIGLKYTDADEALDTSMIEPIDPTEPEQQ